MHSSFPHPKDRLIILRISGTLDPVDLESIPSLLESRIQEHGQIQMLLEVHDHEEALRCDEWKKAILDPHLESGVERIAIVTASGESAWGQSLAAEFASSQAAHFLSEEREKALSWVQTGGVA